MGWFKKALTRVVKSPVGKAMDTFSAVFSNPIKSVKAVVGKTTIKQVTKEHFEKPLASQIAKTVLSTAGYATALYGGAAVATAAKAGTLKAGIATAGKSLIPKTLKGKVIGAVAAPIVLGAVVRAPGATIGKIAGAPGELAQFGGDVASFGAAPSKETAKQIFKESPLISAGLAAAGIATVGVAGAGIVSGVLTRQEMKKQTAALEKSASKAVGIAGVPAVGAVGAGSPILPQRTSVSATKKRYKRRTAKKTPSVKQSVRVNIISKPVATGLRILNKRYINQELLN